MFHESGTICYSLFAYSSITELPIDRCTKASEDIASTKSGNFTDVCMVRASLRSKRFRLVSEQKEFLERDFRF